MSYYQPGEYLVTCIDHGFEVASTKRPMIVFNVRVDAMIERVIGPSGEAVEQAHPVAKAYDRKIRLTIVEDNQESLDYAIRKLRYAGWQGTRFEELDLLDRQFRAVCTIDGQFEDWEMPLPPMAAKPIKKVPELARKLNALFGKRLTETVDPALAAQQQSLAAAGGGGEASIGDEDIPF